MGFARLTLDRVFVAERGFARREFVTLFGGARVRRRFCLVLIKPSHYDSDGYVSCGGRSGWQLWIKLQRWPVRAFCWPVMLAPATAMPRSTAIKASADMRLILPDRPG